MAGRECDEWYQKVEECMTANYYQAAECKQEWVDFAGCLEHHDGKSAKPSNS